MEKTKKDEKTEVTCRLDALIALAVRREIKSDDSLKMRDMIALLASAGLKYAEIAAILGKSPSYVASELTVLK